MTKGMSRLMSIVYDSDDGDSDDDESNDGFCDAEHDDVEDDIVVVRDDCGKILQMEEEECDDGVNYWSDPTPNHQSLRKTLPPTGAFSNKIRLQIWQEIIPRPRSLLTSACNPM